MQHHHPHRDGETCRRFLCGDAGPSTFASYHRDTHTGLMGCTERADLHCWGFLNEWNEKGRLTLAYFCISAQPGTDLKAIVTCSSGLHGHGWAGQMMFENLSSNQKTARQQYLRPCKVWNCSHSFRARHWTSHNHAVKALIENTKELSWQLLLGVSKALADTKIGLPLAYEYNLELIVKCVRPCKNG